MFDKLVESSKQRQRGRTGKFFFITGVVYAVTLAALGAAAVFWFNPGLADAAGDIVRIIPPPPPVGPAPPKITNSTPNAPQGPTTPGTFTTPSSVTRPLPGNLAKAEPVAVDPGLVIPGWVSIGGGRTVGAGIPGGFDSGPTPPPPPPSPTPSVKLTPTPTPTPTQRMYKVSEGVLQGSAIKRVTPTYPQIAKAVRASGAVQVQVTISEEGHVIEAVAISGHPLLRNEAVQAARQWVFSPTKLSNVPVQVTGIITFNFTLNQ